MSKLLSTFIYGYLHFLYINSGLIYLNFYFFIYNAFQESKWIRELKLKCIMCIMKPLSNTVFFKAILQ